MLSRFNFYEFVAVIMPGIFSLWAAATVTNAPFLRRLVLTPGGLTETSVLIVVGYVTGLILISGRITQRFLLWRWGGFPSARWLLPTDRTFSQKYKTEFALAVKEKFGVDPTNGGAEPEQATLKRNQEIFFRCYRAVEKVSEMPQTFVAQYGLYRSLFTTFVLLSAVSAANFVGKY